MRRALLSTSFYIASLDKQVLEKYRNKEISKSQAMKKIEENNGLEKGELSEEYFDYLFESCGYGQEDESE